MRKINLKIEFRKLKKRDRTSGMFCRKKSPLIIINTDLSQIDQIAVLFHEFTHFVQDLIKNMQFNLKNVSKLKVFYVTKSYEEDLCYRIQNIVKKEFKKFFGMKK